MLRSRWRRALLCCCSRGGRAGRESCGGKRMGYLCYTSLLLPNFFSRSCRSTGAINIRQWERGKREDGGKNSPRKFAAGEGVAGGGGGRKPGGKKVFLSFVCSSSASVYYTCLIGTSECALLQDQMGTGVRGGGGGGSSEDDDDDDVEDAAVGCCDFDPPPPKNARRILSPHRCNSSDEDDSGGAAIALFLRTPDWKCTCPSLSEMS